MADADASRHDSHEPNPSKTSSRALDGLNVFLADVRDGMGPFLGTFLREKHHWDAGRVGIALAASQIGTVLAQTPAGALIDGIRWKPTGGRDRGGGGRCGLRRDLSGADACGGGRPQGKRRSGRRRRSFHPGRGGPDSGPGRAGGDGSDAPGRNEAFNHGGNVVAAALAGGSAYLLGYGALFFLVAGMADRQPPSPSS